MIQPDPARRGGAWWWWTGALVIVAFVAVTFSRFYLPERGFTYVLDFGDQLPLQRLAEVERAPIYVHEAEAGYDAEFYAQLALRPAADDPALAAAIDAPVYRARRPLLGWIAWAIGIGRPWWVLNAFALLNCVAWLGLAVLLLRWFPPGGGVQSFVRWAGVMLSAGVLGSLRHALTDGPALLAICGVVALAESGRSRAAAALGGVAGLLRETAVLAASALAPAPWRDWRAWLRAAVPGLVVVLPLGVWLIHLQQAWMSQSGFSGHGFANFTWPLRGYVQRWLDLIEGLRGIGWQNPYVSALLLHVAITVQVAWLVLRPRWSDAWWRVGAAHVVLFSVLDFRVWEGFSGASGRVLLPLLVAFNVLAPRTRGGLVLLLAGNLTVFAGIFEMRPPPQPTFAVAGPAELVVDRAGGAKVAVKFVAGFYGPESRGADAMRWTSGNAVMRIENPHAFGVRAQVACGLRSATPRPASVRLGARVLWQGELTETLRAVTLPAIEVPPGGVDLDFSTSAPDPAVAHRPPIAIAVYNVRVFVEAVADGAPK